MEKLAVVIDGGELRVEKGTTLLAAARRAGIRIPALCHHESLEPYGSCRLCLVEVSRGGRARLTTSCNYPVLRSGEVVSTSSDRVVRARRVVMELLLARCPGSARVAEMAASIGVTNSRYPSPTPSRLGAHDEALVNCILCGLCVRACEQAIGASAIGFADRGPNRHVASPFDLNAEACIGCGACAAVCPTGVIRLEDTPEGVRRLAFFHTDVPLLRCGRCGRFFAPAPQMGQLRQKAGSLEERLELCPDCRKRQSSEMLARWQAVAR
jgi:bidirectional [NiFe] hydrogenase diaphorase subunit